MSQVALVNVSKLYDGVEAVHELTLRVEDGELMVLVGPSGSGKSTVLRLIAGLEEVTAGEVLLGGRVANRVPPRDRDVAMVFQDYALYPHMTVAQNIGFSLAVRRVPKAEVRRRVERVAAMLGIGGLLARRPHALSGGQQQRVALGRAIVREPRVFLFDEPLSNLDAALRVTTRSDIRALQRRLGTTTVYVTHDQEEAMTLGDRLAVMCRGRLQQVGPPPAVYSAPANRFVASFIGSPPMNFLEGAVERNGAGLAFAESAAGGGLVLPLPPRFEAAAAPLVRRPVVLGLRPQAMSRPPGGAGVPSLNLEVEHVEFLGDVVDLVGAMGGGARFVARVPARDGFPSRGRVTLGVDLDRAHLFEPGEFGRNLLVSG